MLGRKTLKIAQMQQNFRVERIRGTKSLQKNVAAGAAAGHFKGDRMKINYKYMLGFVCLFAMEALIALFVHDKIVRPYVGEILVVLLLYCFVRIFIKAHKMLPLGILIFCTAVEVSQYFHLVERLGLGENKIATTLIGTTFAPEDILCYAIGFALLVLWQWRVDRPAKKA